MSEQGAAADNAQQLDDIFAAGGPLSGVLHGYAVGLKIHIIDSSLK